MSTILIRQIPDDYADSTGLAKYNRSRMPGCKDRFSVALNTDGRYLTNLDEDSFTVPKDKKEEVKQKRENFQTFHRYLNLVLLVRHLKQFYTNLINHNINLNGYHLTNTKLKWEKLKSRLFLIRDIGLNMKQWRRKSIFLNKLQNMSK